jgi:hypothetical protein
VRVKDKIRNATRGRGKPKSKALATGIISIKDEELKHNIVRKKAGTEQR